MTASQPESENDSWHIWMCFTWLDDYWQSLRMQPTEETNLQNWGFNIWCLVWCWPGGGSQSVLSLLEKFSVTMPEHGSLVCCESDCKWKTFVINGELFSRIVNTEVINDQYFVEISHPRMYSVWVMVVTASRGRVSRLPWPLRRAWWGCRWRGRGRGRGPSPPGRRWRSGPRTRATARCPPHPAPGRYLYKYT